MNVEHTKMLIELIQQADWFRNVGNLIEKIGIHRAADWHAAIAYSSTDEWDDVLTDAKNDQADFIAEKCGWGFLRDWNKLADGLRHEMRSLVEKKIASNIQSATMPKSAADSLTWIIAHGCLGAAFLGWPNEERFFTPATQYVIDGYLPCGWEGTYPQGRMIVF